MQTSGHHLLYLDFDGVLHPSDVYRLPGVGPRLADSQASLGHRLFEHAPLLVELLNPYPHVRIVLSTNWVHVLGYDRTKQHLPSELQERVIGATYHRRLSAGDYEQSSRGQQVWADVQRRLPSAWLSLDDDDELWPEPALCHWFRTDKNGGIGIGEGELALRLQQTFA